MIDAIFRRVLIPISRGGRIRSLIALVLAVAVLAFVLLAHGFIAALLWDHWHPVAGIIWLLFGSGMATMGSRWGEERGRLRSRKRMMEATDVLMREAEKMRANGGDGADR